eukprot:1073-Hanusia_phi.AAC.2
MIGPSLFANRSNGRSTAGQPPEPLSSFSAKLTRGPEESDSSDRPRSPGPAGSGAAAGTSLSSPSRTDAGPRVRRYRPYRHRVTVRYPDRPPGAGARHPPESDHHTVRLSPGVRFPGVRSRAAEPPRPAGAIGLDCRRRAVVLSEPSHCRPPHCHAARRSDRDTVCQTAP